jgi:hypothetical protein
MYVSAGILQAVDYCRDAAESSGVTILNSADAIGVV